MNSFRRLQATIADINRRYHAPRIGMSLAVRLSLLALRVYLLFLVGLMIYKFILIVT
jgi:hypothetical protein